MAIGCGLIQGTKVSWYEKVDLADPSTAPSQTARILAARSPDVAPSPPADRSRKTGKLLGSSFPCPSHARQWLIGKFYARMWGRNSGNKYIRHPNETRHSPRHSDRLVQRIQLCCLGTGWHGRHYNHLQSLNCLSQSLVRRPPRPYYVFLGCVHPNCGTAPEQTYRFAGGREDRPASLRCEWSSDALRAHGSTAGFRHSLASSDFFR